MIKIAHFADIHWRGLSHHDVYKSSFEDAFKKLRILKPDIILIAGDIVHSKTQGISPELIDCLSWWFTEMGNIAETHITLGNHDGLIFNPHREDAISPIVRAINHPKVHLHKKSGTVELQPGFYLNNFSCFDEAGWSNVKPVEDAINIATFHGAVYGSKTDQNWRLENQTSIDFFAGFDFVLLGDIHKQQYLNHAKTIAYCGSTIQQNYGETPDKGFLFWAIESKEVYQSRHVSVKNYHPHITLDYDGDIDEFLNMAEPYPDGTRFRIRVPSLVNQGEIAQVRLALKESKSPREIVVKQDIFIREQSQEIAKNEVTLRLDNFDTVKELLTNYYQYSHLSERELANLEIALKQVWAHAAITVDSNNGKWSLRSLEFSNTFGYGEDNRIDFDATTGITGIFGKNRSGKSSICGTISYAIFNGTDRGPMKGVHVINARKNFCRATAIISKAGTDYKIDRQTVKHTTRKGEVSAATVLNLFRLENGDEIDLSGEQRRNTEKTLRKLVGEFDNFLLTGLSSQGNMNNFIDKNAADRKAILARFLQLEVFDRLYVAAKDEEKSIKAVLQKLPQKQFEVLMVDKESKIKARDKERNALQGELDEAREALRKMEFSFATNAQNTEGFTSMQVDEQAQKVDLIKSKIRTANEQQEKLARAVESKQIKLDEFETELENIDLDKLRIKLKDQNSMKDKVASLTFERDKAKAELKRDKKQVEQLSDVPCGDAFPTCKYIQGAIKAKKTLEKKIQQQAQLVVELNVVRRAHKSLLKHQLAQQISKADELAADISTLKMDLVELESKLSKGSILISNAENRFKAEEEHLHGMMANVIDDDSSKSRNELIHKIRATKENITKQDNKLSLLSEQIGTLNAEVAELGRNKHTFDKLGQQLRAYQLLSSAFGKNGIPLEIVKNKLPQINAELSNILNGAVEFTVELESEPSSNSMEIYLNYGDSRRIIECGSGMEKMMSSIAIRAALTNISNLPKPDFFIIDEGFGALDANNLESCSLLLKSLTRFFRTILVISHVDTVKDIVDNVIEISKRGLNACVQSN